MSLSEWQLVTGFLFQQQNPKAFAPSSSRKVIMLCFQQFSSVQFSRSVVSDSLRPHVQQHARLPCSSSSPRVCSNSCPLSWGCHPTISSSVVPFSPCLQSFPASGSFPMSWLFASGDPSIRASASASVLPMTIQGSFPLGLTGLVSFQSRGPWRIFSSSTLWKHQLLGIQPFLWSNSHIHTCCWKNHSFD